MECLFCYNFLDYDWHHTLKSSPRPVDDQLLRTIKFCFDRCLALSSLEPCAGDMSKGFIPWHMGHLLNQHRLSFVPARALRTGFGPRISRAEAPLWQTGYQARQLGDLAPVRTLQRARERPSLSEWRSRTLHSSSQHIFRSPIWTSSSRQLAQQSHIAYGGHNYPSLHFQRRCYSSKDPTKPPGDVTSQQSNRSNGLGATAHRGDRGESSTSHTQHGAESIDRLRSDADAESLASSVTKYLHDRLPHRPTKEELLAAATNFGQRLKVRFKWMSIRSMRPWNIDEWGAFVSWFMLGHIVWILVGTTTFFSLVILSINTVMAQGKPHQVVRSSCCLVANI